MRTQKHDGAQSSGPATNDIEHLEGDNSGKRMRSPPAQPCGAIVAGWRMPAGVRTAAVLAVAAAGVVAVWS